MKQSYPGLSPDASDAAKHEWTLEHRQGGFTCIHCGNFVVIDERMGTINRNHCNTCLWSMHVDIAKGDRKAACHGQMEPIGLTFKHEGAGKVGELMLVHRCKQCQRLSINRIARDDPEDTIMNLYLQSLKVPLEDRRKVHEVGIYLANTADQPLVQEQLFGKPIR